MSCLFLSHWGTTQTLSQIKSQEFIGHIQEYFITTSPLTYDTDGIQDFVKCYIKSWVHLNLQPDNMLYGGLQINYLFFLTEQY